MPWLCMTVKDTDRTMVNRKKGEKRVVAPSLHSRWYLCNGSIFQPDDSNPGVPVRPLFSWCLQQRRMKVSYCFSSRLSHPPQLAQLFHCLTSNSIKLPLFSRVLSSFFFIGSLQTLILICFLPLQDHMFSKLPFSSLALPSSWCSLPLTFPSSELFTQLLE